MPVGDEWAIFDDGLSTNGTFVNTEPIRGRHRLKPGDNIRVGGTSLLFNGAGAPPASTTLSPRGAHLLELVTPAQRRVLAALARSSERAGGWPAGPQELADELHLSVDTVKTHLRELYDRCGLKDVPRSEKRTRLADLACSWGL